MALQENHDLADRPLAGPAGGDAVEPDLADAVDFEQPARRCLDDIEHRLAEGRDEPFGKMRADALDQSRGEITLDALTRRGRRDLEKQRPELRSVFAVLLPMSAGLNVLAGMDFCGAAENGDEVALAAHLDPQHTEAALAAVERDTIDQPR